MAELGAIHWQRLVVAAIASGLAGLVGIEDGFFTTLLALGFAAVASIALWVALRPAQTGWLDGLLAVGLAGIGPAIALGTWWYWWSDFCIFDCEGVSRQPMAFVAWFLGTLGVSMVLGAAVGFAGKRALDGAVAAA